MACMVYINQCCFVWSTSGRGPWIYLGGVVFVLLSSARTTYILYIFYIFFYIVYSLYLLLDDL